MNEQRLTQWEAISLMVGAGVGAGIMAVPYLTMQVGFYGLAMILPVAWAASSLVHLMLAEVLFRTGRDLQIVELMHIYVLRGRFGRWLLWAIFALLSIAFLANLAAYVSGAGEILAGPFEHRTSFWRKSSFTGSLPAWFSLVSKPLGLPNDLAPSCWLG